MMRKLERVCDSFLQDRLLKDSLKEESLELDVGKWEGFKNALTL